MSEQIPEIDGAQFDYPGQLAMSLRNKVTIPVWMNFANFRIKLTHENIQGVIIGLQLAVEIESQNKEKEYE